jgi:hypothetical protein
MIALALGALLVGAASACGAALLRPAGRIAFALGAAVLAYAEIVAISHALSLVDAYERTWFLVAVTAVAAVALVGVALARPAWPSPRVGTVLRAVLGDPVVSALGAVVLVALGYLLALALFTPPVERDALAYHLTKALFWMQQESVAPVAGVADTRINELPPDAEIVQGATLLLSGSVRWVGLIQFGALLVCVLAVYGIGLHLGLRRREAAFGALLVPTLPVIALQAPTALNDLVVAALVATSAFFAMRGSIGALVLAAISVALLVGTKGTGLFALPVLLLLVVCTHRGRRLWLALALGAVSVSIGASWYVLNAVRGKGALGSAGEAVGTDDGALAVAARTTRYLIEMFELPGAPGSDRLLYLVAAAAVAVVGALMRRWQLAAVAALLTALPLLVLPAERVLHKVYWNGWELIGYPEATAIEPSRNSTIASNVHSWYGPAALALVLAMIPIVVHLWRRGRLPSVALVLAAAPVVFLVESAVAISFHNLNGRYVMGAVPLVASTWGLARRWMPGAVALVAVATVCVSTSLVNYAERPSGVDLLEGTNRPSVWTLPREWAQAIEPEVAVLIGYADDNVPRGEPVAVARDASYPFAYAGFPRLEHRLVYADSLDEATRSGARWAVLPLTAGGEQGWCIAFRSPPWAIYRRVRDDAGCG